MKKYLLIASVLTIGITACQKETDPAVVSNNTKTAAGPATNPGNGRPVLGVPMDQANWQIGSYITDGKDRTEEFLKYAFHFGQNHVMTVARLDINQTITGYWDMSEGSTASFFTINVNDPGLSELNGTWTILLFNVDSAIDLVMGSKTLRFVRS